MAKNKQFTQAQLEQKLDQMKLQREELLGLIRPLSNAMRNWKPNDDQRNFHEILVHVGSSECRYVSHRPCR